MHVPKLITIQLCFIKVKALLPEQLILYMIVGANEIFAEIFSLFGVDS